MCRFRHGSTNDDEEEEARERRRRAREERKKMRDLEESGTADVINTNRYMGNLTPEVVSQLSSSLFIRLYGKYSSHFLWIILISLVLMIPSQPQSFHYCGVYLPLHYACIRLESGCWKFDSGSNCEP